MTEVAQGGSGQCATKLPEFFSARRAQAYVLGQLQAHSSPEILVSALRENLLQHWSNYEVLALMNELNWALAELARKGYLEFVPHVDNPKVRLIRS